MFLQLFQKLLSIWKNFYVRSKNLKINVKLVNLKKQIINLIYFEAPKRIPWRYWANRIKAREGIASLHYERENSYPCIHICKDPS